MEKLFGSHRNEEAARRIVLSPNHEQQHQESMLTDIKRDSTNRLDFCFDNETPRHKVYLQAFRIANRSVSCREYLESISDDAYARPELWLSEGLEAVRKQGCRAPLYWERVSTDSTGWRIFTLRGWHPLSALLDTPVSHVSFLEADAFARWRGCRLPTEGEWELARRLHPAIASGDGLDQLFGDCWEWTANPPAPWGIQRQVYVQPDDSAWRVLRHARDAVAFHGNTFGRLGALKYEYHDRFSDIRSEKRCPPPMEMGYA
jgi:formylglycine-generating enzyme required for sulfatase activity